MTTAVDDLPKTACPSRARELFDTVRHLYPRQIGHLVKRRVLDCAFLSGLPPALARPPAIRPGPFNSVPFLSFPATKSFDPAHGTLSLLNISVPHRVPVAWQRDDLPPLWVLELQYFHWLRPNSDPETGFEFMLDWICTQPDRLDTMAWNPFGVAMRIMQWTRLLSQWQPALEERSESQIVLSSLYRQARFLSTHLEFDLLGNHLIKTAAGLYSAGCFFSGDEADEWKERAGSVILAQASTQTLPDGGHYERSPMYHLLVLIDLVDVINMTPEGSGQLRSELTPIAERQVAVAEELVDPIGQIPLTNDSVLGQAPETTEVLAYAAAVLGHKNRSGRKTRLGPNSVSTTDFSLPDFGMYRLVTGDWLCWIDAGLPGPDCQPSHAHSDLGSILAWLGRTPLLVEAGVCVYGGNPVRRQYDRNAYGHNVFVLDGHGVCHCWREFRVGRRVRHVDARKVSDPSGLEIRHDGFAFLPGTPTHERHISLRRDELQIVDSLGFRLPRKAVAEIVWHLDPAVKVEQDATGLHLNLNTYRLDVAISGPGTCRIEHWPLARRFYRSETGPVLIVRAEVESSARFETAFRLLGKC